MSKAYCVQESYMYDRETGNKEPRDLSSAQRFGSIVTVLGSNDKGSMTPDTVISKIAEKLQDFNYKDDYIFTSGGDPINFALVLSVLTSWGIPNFKYLRWERERSAEGKPTGNGFYVAVEIPLGDWEDV